MTFCNFRLDCATLGLITLNGMKLEKMAVSWHGLLPCLTKFVEQWQPPALRGETKYRDHLLETLRASVPGDAKVEKEYRHRGTTIDVWLKWPGLLLTDEIAFELKVNLKKKADYDRLVGQIEGMEPAKNKTIVVLIGDTDQGLFGRLKERYSKYIHNDLGPTMAIVCVPRVGV